MLVQQVMVIARCLFVNVEKARPPVLRRLVPDIVIRFGQIDAGPLRQKLQRFHKGILVVFHHEGQHIPAGVTSEAIIHLLGFTDTEGRRLFIMKRTKAHIVGPGPLQ